MRLLRINLVLVIVLLFIINPSLHVQGVETETALLDTNINRTFVPIRFVTEQFGAQVNWVENERAVYIIDQTNEIKLTIGEAMVQFNHSEKEIDAPPFIKDDTTYVPLRFVSTILGGEVNWNAKTSTVSIQMNDKELILPTVLYHATKGKSAESAITATTKTFEIGKKSIKVNIVTVDTTNPSIDLKIGLAEDRIGAVESLEEIAKRNNALVAINGTYFNAYDEIKEPYGVIVVDGKVLHIGKNQTVFSFDATNQIDFSIMNPEVVGLTNGSSKPPYNWYSYGINRTPPYNTGASVVIFTPERGETIGFDYGTNIVVENGKVTNIVTDQDVNIPKNGFVINLIGSEVHNLLSRFTKGTTVSYYVTNMENSLEEIEGALGAGPRLVKDGKITIDLQNESFNDEQIQKTSTMRSAIGVTKDQKLLFVTTTATINELAEIMQQAGAYQAMCLDGNASSGLYYKGEYLKEPTRDISNAILVIQK